MKLVTDRENVAEEFQLILVGFCKFHVKYPLFRTIASKNWNFLKMYDV